MDKRMAQRHTSNLQVIFYSLFMCLVGFSAALLLTSSRWSFSSKQTRKTCIAFGDSITQHGFGVNSANATGWLASLSAHWVRRMDVINRGYSGYTTREGIELLPGIIKQYPSIDLFLIFFGANDAVIQGVAQHVPLNEYRTNLQSMINRIRRSLGSSAKIVLITPPPVYEPDLKLRNRQRGKSVELDRINANTKEYADVVVQVGRENDALVVDIFSAYNHDSKRYLSDGLHLSDVGNEQLFTLLIEKLEKNIPELRLDSMPST